MAILILSDNGTFTRKTTLAAAVAAGDVVGKTIIVTTNQTIDNVIVPFTIALEIRNAAVITVNSGKTLTINGPFIAPLVQCFAGSGTVSFGINSTNQYQPVWKGGTGAPANGRRNYIINGNFDIWQRGTSQTSNGYGSVDRWNFNATGSTFAVSLQSFTVGQTSVPNEPKYYCRTIVSSVASAANYVDQRHYIESVRALAGKTAIVSFWAKADASKNISIEFAQNFGSGGSPSAEVTNIGVATCALTTAWQKFTVTVTLPSITGKTLGTNNDDFVKFKFWFDAGSTYGSRTNSLGQQSGTFDIAQVQLEEGSVATQFEYRPLSEEKVLCERYCYALSAANGFGSSAHVGFAQTNSTTAAEVVILLPTTMRGVPALTSSGAFNLVDGTANFTGATLTLGSASQQSPNAAVISVASVTGLTLYRAYRLVINSTGVIILSAEL